MKTKNNFLFTLFMTGIWFVCAIGTSYACKCAFSPNAEEEYKKVDAVFLGMVETSRKENQAEYRTHFKVLKKYKGVEADEVDVFSRIAGPACGIAFDLDQEYIVYAYFNQGRIETSSCTLTRKAEGAEEDLQYLDALIEGAEKVSFSECERWGGTVQKTEECDGSMSDWCVISEKEQCYADQVKNGHCTAGYYSEELKGIVGITPRVLCDGGFFDGQ